MFQFQNTVTLSDLINAALLLIAVLGIFLTYRQMRESYRTQRASFFKELYSTMWSDSEIRDMYYRVEYGKLDYSESFHGSPDERLLDRLLSFTDLLCELYSQNIISDNEMRFFQYELATIYKNDNIHRYIKALDNWFVERGVGTKPYRSLLSYCQRAFDK